MLAYGADDDRGVLLRSIACRDDRATRLEGQAREAHRSGWPTLEEAAYTPGRWRPRRKTSGSRMEQTTSAGTAAARAVQRRLLGGSNRGEECGCCWCPFMVPVALLCLRWVVLCSASAPRGLSHLLQLGGGAGGDAITSALRKAGGFLPPRAGRVLQWKQAHHCYAYTRQGWSGDWREAGWSVQRLSQL